MKASEKKIAEKKDAELQPLIYTNWDSQRAFCDDFYRENYQKMPLILI